MVSCLACHVMSLDVVVTSFNAMCLVVLRCVASCHVMHAMSW